MEQAESAPRRPRCFVVIGFGVKTDLATGRAIDLDKTYEELIRPALDAAGVIGFRAIDINRTGTIDSIMYKWLFEAEVVVADLSTLNANVLYEVGVRHALKPNTTILIAESVLLKSLPFDLSHTIVHAYKLDGETLDEEDKPRFRATLATLLRETAADPQQDSPVYDFLPDMVAPSRGLSEEEDSDVVDLPLSAILSLALLARNKGDLQRAGSLLEAAVERDPGDQYLRRQLASVLSERAAAQPDLEAARRDLEQAEAVMAASDPSISTDPQVLTTAGEINRGLYEKTRDVEYLKKSAWQFTRAFYIKQGPAHGIEGAKLHAEVARQAKRAGRGHPAVQTAAAICAAVAAVCKRQTSEPGFDTRDDRGLVYTSMAQGYLGMGRADEARALLPAIEAASGRNLTWHEFVTENYPLKWVGTLMSPGPLAGLLPYAGTAAAAVFVTLLTTHWLADKTPPPDPGPPVVVEQKEPIPEPPGQPPIREVVTPPAVISSSDLRLIQAPMLSSLGRIEGRMDRISDSLTDVRDETLRVSELHSRLEAMEKLNKSMLATHSSVLTALERNTKTASGCTENTAAILQLANILVDQTKRINVGLQQVSGTARSAPRSAGPHIQFDALRPGLAEGFAYPLEDGDNPIRELGLSLTLNSRTAGGPAVTVRDERTGKRTELVRAESRPARDRNPQQVRFGGIEIGEYCSLLTLNRDPRTARWMGIVRMREGCGDSCSSGCGVQ